MTSSVAPEKVPERTRNIVRGVRSLTIQNLATSGMGFVFVASLLRLLPQVQYGIYSAVILSTGIGANFALFGLNSAATRFVALLREEDEGSSWVAARSIFVLSTIFSIVAGSVFLVLSPYLSLFFAKSTSWTWEFLFGGVFLILSGISATTQGIIQGMKKYGTIARILFVSKLVMLVFTIAILEFDKSVSVAIWSWILYYLVILVWSLSIIAPEMFRAKGVFDYSKVMKYSLPLGIAAIITVISSNADQVVVGGYLTPVSLGIYNAAITISGALGITFVTPLTTALLPEASSSVDKTISIAFRLALRFVVLGLLPIALLMSAMAPQLLSLFTSGKGYLGGTESLQLIAFFYVFYGIQLISLILLQASGRTTQVMIIGAVAAATDILVAISLVPTLGILGAALSRVAVSLVSAALSIYLLRSYAKTFDSFQFYLKGAIAAGVPFIPILLLSQYLSSRIITLVPYSLAYAVLFLVCVKAMKLLSNEDRSFISHLLPASMQKIARYI